METGRCERRAAGIISEQASNSQRPSAPISPFLARAGSGATGQANNWPTDPQPPPNSLPRHQHPQRWRPVSSLSPGTIRNRRAAKTKQTRPPTHARRAESE